MAEVDLSKYKSIYSPDPNIGGADDGSWRRATDLGVDAARGAIGLGKGLIGIGDLATGGLIGKGARAIGYNPEEADDMVSDLYSKQRKRAEQEVEQADGFLGTAGAMIRNPSTIVGAAIQSAPNLLGGAGVARGLALGVERAAMKSALARGLTGEAAEAYAQRAAARYLATGAGESAAKTAAAVGDGLLTAGGIAEDIRAKNPDDVAAMYYAVPAGVITGAITRGGSHFEGGGIEAAIGTGGRAGAVRGGVLRRLGKGAAGEAIEEGLQSPQEQVWQNVATDEQDLLKGVGKSAAQGALAGGLSGGFFHAMTPDARRHTPTDLLTGGDVVSPDNVVGNPGPSQMEQVVNKTPSMSVLDRINQMTGVARPEVPEDMRNDRKSMLQALEEPTGLYGTDENGQEIQLDAGRAAAMAAGLQPLSQDDMKARQKKGAVTPEQVNYLYEKFGQPTPAINPATGVQDGVEWHGEHFGVGQDDKLAAKQAALSQAESKKAAGQREAEVALSKVLREDSGAAHLTQKDFNQYVKPFLGAPDVQTGVGRMLHENSPLSKIRINLGKEMVNLQDEAKGNPQKVEELRKQLGIYNKWLESMGFDAVEPIYPKAKQGMAPKAQPKQEGAVAQAEKVAVVRTKRNGELITKSREQVQRDIANMSDTHKEWLKYIVGERKAGNSVTYDDVANHFGVSKQAVSKALTKREITQDVINRISTDSDAVMARVEAQQRVGDAVVKAREEMGPKARQWLDYMVAERNAGRPVTTQSIAEHFGADLGKVRDAFIRYKLTDKSFAQVANDSQSMHVKDTDPVLSDLLGGTGEEGTDKATGYRIAAGEGEVNSDDIITESQSTKSRLLSQAGKLVEASKKAAARGKSESADKLSTAAKLLMDRAVGASTESTEEDATTTNVKGAKAAAAAMVRKGQVANINGQDEISTRARSEYMRSLEPGQAPDKIALMQHIEQAHKDAEVEKRTRDYYLRQDIEDKVQAKAAQQRAEADNDAANSVYKDRAIREWNVSAEDNEPEYNQLTLDEQRNWQLSYVEYQESLRMGDESIDELQARLEQDRKDILDGRAQLNEQRQLTDNTRGAGGTGQVLQSNVEDSQTDTRGPGGGEVLYTDAGENSQAPSGSVRSTPVVTVEKRRTIAKTGEGSQGSEGRDVARTIDEVNSGTNPDVGKHGNVSKIDFKNGTDAANHLASTFKDGRLASLARLLAPQLKSVEVKFAEKGETIYFDDGTVDQELTDRMAAGVGGISVLTNDTGRIQIFMNKASPLGLDKVALLHELVHAATQAKLNSVKESDLHKNLAVIAMQLQADLAGKDSGVDGSSFFSKVINSPDELLAYALTSPTFYEYANSKYVSGTLAPEAKKQTLWQRFVSAVQKLLGIKQTDAPALDRAIKPIYVTDRNTGRTLNEELDATLRHILTSYAKTPAQTGVGQQTRQEINHSGLTAEQRTTQAEANIAKLPAPLQKPVNRIWDTLTNGYKTGVYIGSFTRDLLEKAAGMMDHAKEYADTLDKKEALRHQMQSRLESIMQMAAPLTNGERNRLNAFLKDSTMSQKWGFVPAHDDSVKVDQTMRGKFEALPSTAQEVAKAIFAHGHEILQQKQDILNREINAEYADRIAEAKDAKEVAKLEKERDKLLETYSGRLSKLDGPYAPLKRFGNYVVVARSKEYMDAYKNKDAEAIRNMESDARHNLVQFADTYAEAKAMERDLKATGKYAGDGVHAFEKEKNRDAIYGDASEMFHAFSKLKAMISTDDKKSSNYLDRLVSDLYLSTMAENSARRSEMTRKNIAGADNDMLKAFATQGSADISFIAALSHNNEITKHLALMNDSAHDHAEGKEDRVKLFNEILERHADRMNYVPAPIQNKVMALTSIWMLATSPAYYIQNSLQTAMVTAPYLAGKFGPKAHATISKAYTDLVPSMKDGIADMAKLTKGERDMYKRLTEVGLIDNGVGNELGKWARDGSENKVFSGVIDKLRGLTNKVEHVNRTVAAVAAYRLALPELGHEEAVQYARKTVLHTHGDYSGFNAPRFMSNNFMPGAKLITQFRKYQIIQMSLLGRLARESLATATTQEEIDQRKVARQALAWIMGHTAVMAGGLGLPFVNGFAWALGKAFGDDDTPDDPEVMLRKLIGNKQAADLILGGVPKALGLGMTNKLGLDKVYSLSPFNDIDVSNRKGMEKTIVGLAGPAASLSIKASDSLALFGQGDYYKGLENLLPSGIANVSKAYRFNTEGVTQRNGDVVLTPQEISLVDTLFQGIGLQTNTLADRTADANAVKSYEAKYKDKLDNLTHRYAAAYKSGDGEAMASVREKFAQLQQSQRDNGFKVTPLSTLLRAPIDQAKRERNVVGGVEFSNRNRGFVGTVTAE